MKIQLFDLKQENVRLVDHFSALKGVDTVELVRHNSLLMGELRRARKEAQVKQKAIGLIQAALDEATRLAAHWKNKFETRGKGFSAADVADLEQRLREAMEDKMSERREKEELEEDLARLQEEMDELRRRKEETIGEGAEDLQVSKKIYSGEKTCPDRMTLPPHSDNSTKRINARGACGIRWTRRMVSLMIYRRKLRI